VPPVDATEEDEIEETGEGDEESNHKV